jgi:hypothetical protein
VVEKPPSRQRSKVGNGNKLLPGIDGRSAWARRYKDILHAFVSDAGGADAISEAEHAILRRAATLATECERIEALFALNGCADPGELDLHAKTSAVLSRLLEKVGLKRRVIDVTPTIADVIAEIAAEKAAASVKVESLVAPTIPPLSVLPPIGGTTTNAHVTSGNSK